MTFSIETTRRALGLSLVVAPLAGGCSGVNAGENAGDVQQALNAVYYVATNGSDDNPGTLSQPWATFGKAAARASAGDTVSFRSGTYYLSSAPWLGTSGTATGVITFQSYPGERAVIDGSKLSANTDCIATGAQYLNIKGFEIRGCRRIGINVWGGAHLKISDNVVHDVQNGGIYVGYGAFGTVSDVQVENNVVYHVALQNSARAENGAWPGSVMTQYGTNIRFLRNRIYENYGEGLILNLARDSVAAGNVLYDNYGANLYMDNATGSTFDGNFAYSTGNANYFRNIGGVWGAASGVHMANEDYGAGTNPLDRDRVVNNILVGGRWGFYYGSYQRGGGLKNTVVANNTFYNASQSLLNLDADAGHSGSTFSNNIFYQTGGGAMTAFSGSSGLTFRNNLWWGGSAGSAAGSGDLSADPKLVAVGTLTADSYKLLSSSPAIDRGTSTLAPSADYFGGTRPQGTAVDVGAHEIVSSPTSSCTPLNANGTGLKGEYYNGTSFGSLVLTRTDSAVNFDWGTGAPAAGVPVDNFSVRWSGKVSPRYTGSYTFYTTSDDGVRLWVNGAQLVDNWTDHAPTENSGSVTLTAGQNYDIKLEFYERGGGATSKLWWSSACQSKEIVPAAQLSAQ